MTLKSTETIYSFTLKQLQEHFAEALECDVSQVTVHEISHTSYGQMDQGPGYNVFTGLRVTVKEL